MQSDSEIRKLLEDGELRDLPTDFWQWSMEMQRGWLWKRCVALQQETALLKACNESLAALSRDVWKALEPTGEYEGDVRLVEFAALIHKERGFFEHRVNKLVAALRAKIEAERKSQYALRIAFEFAASMPGWDRARRVEELCGEALDLPSAPEVQA